MAAGSAWAIGEEAQAALDSCTQIEPFSGRIPGFDTRAAYSVTAALRDMRETRGETPVGRKIGFTNRNIWAEYGVYEPIWGHIYSTTLHDIGPGGRIDVSRLPEPRIEPEIVFGLGRDIEPAASLAELAASIEWVAHGFEIVQSIYPGWRFTVADCIADGGLHGGLFVGPKHIISGSEREGLAAALSQLTLSLSRNGEIADTGVGTNVLDGPVQALGHLVTVLAGDKLNPPLRKGEVITTGTLTRAFPIVSGERWSTTIDGFDLPGLSVEIV